MKYQCRWDSCLHACSVVIKYHWQSFAYGQLDSLVQAAGSDVKYETGTLALKYFRVASVQPWECQAGTCTGLEY